MSGAVYITPPAAPLTGRVVLPGSKSITNRALLLAGLARGESRLSGALKSDDTRWMAQALRAMGVQVDEPDDRTFVVTSTGRLQKPQGPLYLGNAGTAMRFLTAAASLVTGQVVLDGNDAMRQRPISPLINALQSLGVKADAPTRCPPVTVQGRGDFSGVRVEIDASLSSQYVSALLMIAPFGRAPVQVALKAADNGATMGARGYVDLTLAAMARFGAKTKPLGPQTSGDAWCVGPTGYVATDFEIEPDASAATYFWAAGALTCGGVDLGLQADGFTQPDAKAQAHIAAFPHMPAVIDGSQMQDAVPTLAVLAAFNATPVRFTGIANLRVKECDRTHALATQLSRIRPGLATEDGDDLVIASDPALASPVEPVALETYDDHRMAMSLALLGLRLNNIVILDPGCVAKTFPGYWDALSGLGVALEK
ncbi:MAG: 3-phosphoshikimate 1-carboxyvinyltransferase [Caulobacteraceae bacterium]